MIDFLVWKQDRATKGKPHAPGLDLTVAIEAPATVIFRAFFDADALGAWWQVSRAVTTPRALGPYAIEWGKTDFRDEVLGQLGGVFHGTVMHVESDRGFFVGEAYWLPPVGDPIGPMALEVSCTAEPTNPAVTRVRVVQSGFEESVRWRRYYEVVGVGWERALGSLKMLLEK